MATPNGYSSSSSSLFLICSILAVHLTLSSSSAVDFIPVEPTCRGSIAECLISGADSDLGMEEFAMDSDINRRMLAATRYISYGALRRNTVPCSRRGASYYNCRPGAQANPYTRGCNRITRCRN
ncbi:ralf-like 33 [Euphorbia peplus]|nr:ralf-like 33 [Euphorbia peplus]